MARADLNLELVHLDGKGVVRATGELDVSSAGRLRSFLTDVASRTDGDVIVDMSGVSFTDSAGLGVLVGVYKRVAANDARLVLRHPGTHVRRVLSISGLDQVFVVED